MKYRGVAHHVSFSPELYALYKHAKSFKHLPKEHQAAAEAHEGDIHRHANLRDTPEEAMEDALALCEKEGLEVGYALIKREDGHYFTDVKSAHWAIDNGR